jgi:hypothetical protein
MNVSIEEIAFIKSRGIDKRINQSVLLFILTIVTYFYVNVFVSIFLLLVFCANAAIALTETVKAMNDFRSEDNKHEHKKHNK